MFWNRTTLSLLTDLQVDSYMRDASSWRVCTSSPALPPPRCAAGVSVSLNQRAVPGLLLGQVLRWWPTSKQNEHLFSDMHACGMGYFTKNMTYGWDQEGKCGLSGATCTLVQSSTLSSMQSTRSDAPVSLKAMCVGAVAIWGFVVWALERHAAAFTAVFSTIVSAWLTAAVAT